MFYGWVLLMEAVVGLANKDLTSKDQRKVDDAQWFLNSEWCDQMKDICTMWRSDSDRTIRLA